MTYQHSKLYSIVNNKCPHCHSGNFFENNNPYNLKVFSKMNERCPACNEDFRREPGYYFGATYVSYTLTVGFGIFLFLFFCIVFDGGTTEFLWLFGTLLVFLLPVFYRSSRLIWINMFVNFKEHSQSKQ